MARSGAKERASERAAHRNKNDDDDDDDEDHCVTYPHVRTGTSDTPTGGRALWRTPAATSQRSGGLTAEAHCGYRIRAGARRGSCARAALVAAVLARCAAAMAAALAAGSKKPLSCSKPQSYTRTRGGGQIGGEKEWQQWASG